MKSPQKNTFHIVTFGCQMNKLDSEMLQAALIRSGMRAAPGPADSRVLIYNTCSVRRHAEDRVMSHIGQWRKRAETDPDFLVGVVGCMAQRIGEEIIKKFPYVRFVCGTRSFLSVPEYIERLSAGGGHITELGDNQPEFERDPSLRTESHHAYVSIMRGCSNFCTYCVVPHVRGREVSRPAASIIDEAGRLVRDGVTEITLLGQNVNAYGRHSGRIEGAEGGLPELLDRLNEIEGLKRIRFITSHPKDMSEDIMRAVAANGKVCEHLHIPIQSASDRILAAMNRKYTKGHYLDILEKARRIIPEVAFSSDFIVGFPGETEEDFLESLSLLRTVGFQQSYIFRYSPRPGTGAEAIDDDVPDRIKRERQQLMLSAQEEVDTKRRSKLTGSILEIMCTGCNSSRPHEGRLLGRSRHNDIAVFGKNSRREIKPGDTCNIRIEHATALTLFGEEVSPHLVNQRQ